MSKLLLILIVNVLSGCQATTVKLAPEYHLSNKQKANHENRRNCPIYLEEFLDLRQSKSIGTIAFSIVETDIEKVILSALEQFNISKENTLAGSRIKIALVKAYVNSLNTSMAANVVLSTEFKVDNDSNYQPKKFFRGYDVSVNWNSGESEILSLINKAIETAIVNLKKRLCSIMLLSHICSSQYLLLI